MAHKQTEKVYPYIRFEARTLPCFNYYYDIYYLNGKKTVPSNIGDLLTPLGLCYWIADDGCFHIRDFDIYLTQLRWVTLNSPGPSLCDDRGELEFVQMDFLTKE